MVCCHLLHLLLLIKPVQNFQQFIWIREQTNTLMSILNREQPITLHTVFNTLYIWDISDSLGTQKNRKLKATAYVNYRLFFWSAEYFHKPTGHLHLNSSKFTHFYRVVVSALSPRSHLPRSQSSERRGQTERCPGVLEKNCLMRHFCCKLQHQPVVVCVTNQTQKTHDSCQR